MRLPTEQQRLKRRGSALGCLVLGCAALCGCRGPQFDRLDGSPTVSAGGQPPIVDNAQPQAQSQPRSQSHPATHDTSGSQPADASTQSSSTNEDVISESINRGHREAALNHYEQAEICYRRVLEIEPEHPVANHRLAILADRREDFATSEKCYLISLKHDPHNPDVLSDLGYSYLLQGRHAESERCLLAAIRANPLHRKAVDNLSLLYAKMGDRDRAFAMLKRSVGESEARIRLAQLFPQNRTVVLDDESITASFAPFESRRPSENNPSAASPALNSAQGNDSPALQLPVGAPTAQAAPSGSTSPPGVDAAGATGQSLVEKQLADLMERERQRAIEERTQRQSLSTYTPAPTPPAVPTESVVVSPSVSSISPAVVRPVAEPTALAGASNGAVTPRRAEIGSAEIGRVPDDRINDVFAAIDREGSEASSPPPSVATPSIPVTAPAGSWGGSGIPARTDLETVPQPTHAAPVSAWPAPPPPSQASAAQPTDGVAAAATQLPTSDGQTLRAATPASTTDEWQTRPSRGITIIPDTVTPSTRGRAATPGASSVARTPDGLPNAPILVERPRDQTDRRLSPAQSTAAQPKPAASTDGWKQELNPPTPRWPGRNPDTSEVRTLSDAGSPSDSGTSSRPVQAPRIVPTDVLSTSGGSARPQGPRPPDALDEFEAEIQKNSASHSRGRSSSNSGAATKPSNQPLPQAKPATPTHQPDDFGDSSRSGSDPWSPQIQPRRNLAPLFPPDDFSVTEKKLMGDKPASSNSGSFNTGSFNPESSNPRSLNAGTNWSDLPSSQGPPAPANPFSDRDSGPAIRPGSF
jgi:tetratricopeptide (TPR) repeat protein